MTDVEVEAAARAMCKAAKRDPDAIHYHHNGEILEPYGPMWMVWEHDARVALAAAEAARRPGPVQWCQPMDNGCPTPRKFVIWFDDAERGVMVFEDEEEARETWRQANISWNCYLFGALPLEDPTVASRKPAAPDAEPLLPRDWLQSEVEKVRDTPPVESWFRPAKALPMPPYEYQPHHTGSASAHAVEAEPAQVSYTIDELDDAVRAIHGPHMVRRGDPGWNRPSAMSMAAEHAWVTCRPEDDHSRRLRAGLRDLKTKGMLKPADGWPDEQGG